MQGLRAQAATEDIEKVLGRFQAWTGSRAPKAADEGVRELSYEEALASSRFRWRGRREAAPPEDAPEADSEDKLKAEPGVVPVAVPESSEFPEAKEAAFAATGRPGFAVIPPDLPPQELASPEAARSETARVRRLPRRPQPFGALLAQSTGFGGAGFGTTGLARSWGGDERQVSMSLRVAASEQTLIKMRAAEAGVSASAYLRQCALEVEILRAQVQQLMAASARSLTKELRDGSHAPGGAAARAGEGWFARVRQRLLGWG